MTNHSELSPFVTKRIGADAGEDEAQIKPSLKFSSSYLFTSSNSGQEREYNGPNVG
jgi:hypothetical protein